MKVGGMDSLAGRHKQALKSAEYTSQMNSREIHPEQMNSREIHPHQDLIGWAEEFLTGLGNWENMDALAKVDKEQAHRQKTRVLMSGYLAGTGNRRVLEEEFGGPIAQCIQQFAEFVDISPGDTVKKLWKMGLVANLGEADFPNCASWVVDESWLEALR
jgi:hypothetical protein